MDQQYYGKPTEQLESIDLKPEDIAEAQMTFKTYTPEEMEAKLRGEKDDSLAQKLRRLFHKKK